MDGDYGTGVPNARASSGSHYSDDSHNRSYTEATDDAAHSSAASSSAKNQSLTAVPGHHPHHPPHSSFPTHIRHHTISSIARVPLSKVSSAGHYGLHADETAYAMLVAVIGRASASDLRTVIGKKRADCGMIVESERRPNIQTRRSSRVTSPIRPHGSLTSETSLKPLTLDRRILTTPPIPPPPVDHILDPLKDGDFFSSSISPEKSGWYDSIPRSSSAPSVPFLALERRGSNASFTSAMSADTHLVPRKAFSKASQPRDHDAPRIIQYNNPFDPLTSSPETATFDHHTATPQTHQEMLDIRQSEPHGRYNTFELMAHDSAGVTSYLDPDLSATFRKRMAESTSFRKNDGDARAMGLDTNLGVCSDNAWVGGIRTGKEGFSESDWTFEKPILKAMGDAVRGKIEMINQVDHYHVAEYGCHKETPNPIIAEVIESLCLRSTSKPPKVFSVTHQVNPDFDIRALHHNLASQASSYRKIEKLPSAPSPLILTTFSFAGFTENVLPADTVDFALCTGELSKLQGEISPRPLYAFTSQADEKEKQAIKDLINWLEAKSKEVKKGGILVCWMAIKTRQPPESNSSCDSRPHPPKASPYRAPASLPNSPNTNLFTPRPPAPLTEIHPSNFPHQSHHLAPSIQSTLPTKYRTDIFQLINQALSPAIQSLVTLGEIRTHVAPALVDVSYWPRTLASVQAALDQAEDWEVIIDQDEVNEGETRDDLEHLLDDMDVDKSPPISKDSEGSDVDKPLKASSRAKTAAENHYLPEEIREWAQAGVRIHRLMHPAWKAFHQGRIDRQAYARRIATYCHAMYGPHLKKVLREKGRMDISQCENTVQEMFKILVEKCELGALSALAIDIGVLVLRRK
ncbi:hypothetical protein C361_02630 [Cryptococcus neoformans Tu259-1]|uniref:Uncharacterized protein n=1 Tax=Cryptococcus neoformans Tu259-1 TaxID=1230072 RepID=A0A854QMZ6_CRYNE|nr:hypothetical protein C361_02630 [Cryptococcus neoformans var. grubii Tu259-1]OXG71024.1 hypothetical protein C350_06914 [Cryptococcus neoformans var. grubii MW-RSA36]OXL04831.1 hypothetical protein C348_06901 [Cryptococcus neoformans var. grubii Gb118]